MLFARKRLAHRLLAAAAVLHFTLAPSLLLPPRFEAFAAPAARKATADGLLVQAQKSLALTVASARRSPGIKTKAAGPFVKALGQADKAFKALRKAAASKRPKDFARALAAANRAVGRFNGAYRLSGLTDKPVKKSVGDLNKSWKAYFKRVGGAKTAATPKSTKENARRISALKGRLSKLSSRGNVDPRQKRELQRMQRALERAEAANRIAASQWLALAMLDEVFGWYGGFYDYVVVYDPAYAADYRDVYAYWSDVSTYYDVQYESYYESYSFTSYEESYTVEEEYSVSFTSEEETLITTEETQVETSVETLYQESEASSVLETEEAALQQEEQNVGSAAPVEDPAAIADPEADAQTLDESAAPIDEDDAFALSTGDAAGDAAPAADDAADTAPADNDAATTAPDENGAASPSDDNADQAQPDDDGSAVDTPADGDDGTTAPDDPQPDQPDEGEPDTAAPDDASPDGDQAEPDQPDDSSAEAPDDPQPEEAAPEEAAPEETAPDDSQGEEAQPEVDAAPEAEPSFEEAAPEPEPAFQEAEPEPEPAYQEAEPEPEPAYQEAAPEPEPAAEEPAYDGGSDDGGE